MRARAVLVVALGLPSCKHREAPKTEPAPVASAARPACDAAATAEAAQYSIETNDADAAVERTSEFLTSCGDNEVVRVVKLHAHTRLHQWDSALVEANVLVAVSVDVKYRLERAPIFEQLGQYEYAAQDYRDALSIQHNAEDASQRLSAIYELQGRDCDATKVLRSALEQKPEASTKRALEARLAKLDAERPCSPKALAAAKARAAKLAAAEPVAGTSGGRSGQAIIRYTPGQVASTPVTLNGRTTVNMIVDTGATFVTLQRSLADGLGLRLDPRKTVKLSTAGGIRTGFASSIPEVRVQGLSTTNVLCVVLDDAELAGGSLAGGLLGQSFLGRFRTIQDAKRGQIEISDQR